MGVGNVTLKFAIGKPHEERKILVKIFCDRREEEKKKKKISI